MTDLDTVLRSAFQQCELLGYPLSEDQKQTLHVVLTEGLNPRSDPISELTPEERDVLLQYIQKHQAEGTDWKTALLNDWLQNRDSGSVQFIRDQYGMSWLENITVADLAEFTEEDLLPLKVGDRIEVSNALWEWVQNDPEWLPCVVIGLTEADIPNVCCLVRFENGNEFEIQGIYDWNRPLWRWIK